MSQKRQSVFIDENNRFLLLGNNRLLFFKIIRNKSVHCDKTQFLVQLIENGTHSYHFVLKVQ